ncbi:MAG: hypothetical protein AABY87_04750 [bacterium]
MNLIDAMRTEYGRSKRFWHWSLGFSLLLYLLAALSVFYSAGWGVKTIGVIAFIIQILLFFSRALTGRHFSLGEQIRRLAMLNDGLGKSPSELQLAKLKEKIGVIETDEPAYVGPYYESKLPVGPKRLLEIVAESAFFTSGLARTSVYVFGVISIVGVLLVFTGLIFVLKTELSQSNLDAAAKIAVISMAFWATGDLASTALRFNSLANASEKILDQCGYFLTQAGDCRDEAHATAAEYNCAVIQTPPIPAFIYKWRQNILNEAWRNRKAKASTT